MPGTPAHICEYVLAVVRVLGYTTIRILQFSSQFRYSGVIRKLANDQRSLHRVMNNDTSIVADTQEPKQISELLANDKRSQDIEVAASETIIRSQ